MSASGPGQGVQQLTVENRRLSAGYRVRISQRRVTGQRERRKCSVADSGQADLPCQVLLIARTSVDELPPQVCKTQFVDHACAEDVCVSSQDALHTDIGNVGQWIRLGNPGRS